MLSSCEKEANLLSEPDRQWSVWMEFLRMNLLGRSAWVGSEMLLVFFLLSITHYFI